jgi:hypothetical protein
MSEKEPPVTADDILSTQASRSLAEAAATTIRDAMAAASGRNMQVSAVSLGGDNVVAVVCVLEEFAYVLDITGAREAALKELGKDFPAIAYLTGELCTACAVPEHDTCGMVSGCPCCDDTTARRQS